MRGVPYSDLDEAAAACAREAVVDLYGAELDYIPEAVADAYEHSGLPYTQSKTPALTVRPTPDRVHLNGDIAVKDLRINEWGGDDLAGTFGDQAALAALAGSPIGDVRVTFATDYRPDRYIIGLVPDRDFHVIDALVAQGFDRNDVRAWFGDRPLDEDLEVALERAADPLVPGRSEVRSIVDGVLARLDRRYQERLAYGRSDDYIEEQLIVGRLSHVRFNPDGSFLEEDIDTNIHDDVDDYDDTLDWHDIN